MYNGLLVITEHIVIYDKDFQSLLSFEPNMTQFKKAFNENPEHFTDEIIVSITHFIKTKEIAKAYAIIGETESEITGRGSILNIEYIMNLVDDGYEWIDYCKEDQLEVVARNIRKLIAS